MHMATPSLGVIGSPLESLAASPAPIRARTPAPSRSQFAEADLPSDWTSQLRAVQLDCERLQAEAAAAFESIERAFEVRQRPAQSKSPFLKLSCY
jgi:hypothetical protein